MAGRVHYWKGQQYFLQIAQQLLNQYSDSNKATPLYFIITGDAFPGYEYLVDEMQDFIKKNNLGERIFYTGFEDKMDKFYSSIDLLILPSQLPDPLPTVVLEAMQYGIPVAATEQGGALEMIVENETGILIPIDDVNVASNRIFDLIQIDGLSKMKQKCIERVKVHFSTITFEKNIKNLFHQ
jgi:glycosyltransferase involved in cell wall biosynthesis